MLWSLLWQDQAVLREISRPHGAWLLRTSFESRHYMPVMKATSTRTSKNNIQWWKILLYSDKEIRPLKSSWSLGYNLRKRIVLQRRIVLVLLTAVDLRQTIMYAAWPDNISLQSTSLPPKGFQRVLLVSITIFISSYLHFFSNTSCSKISVTLNQDDLQPSITWQKERARTVLISEFPAPSPAIYINLLRQFSVVQTGRENE